MDLSSIQPLLDWLLQHQEWVAVAIVVIAFLESLALAGVFIPGVVLLFGVSALAGGNILDVYSTIGCAFIGAIMGDGISFFIGKCLKQRIKQLWPFNRYPDWIDNGESYFSRHGGKSIVIGRFVGPIRPVMPLIAGTMDMPTSRFIVINLASALAWAPVYVLPGYAFGASLYWGTQFPAEFKSLVLYLAIAASLIFLVLKISHWQFSPQSRSYQYLQKWFEKREHRRIWWAWLAEHRNDGAVFPLATLALLFFTLILITSLALIQANLNWIRWLDGTASAFFILLQHPWLDVGFQFLARAGQPEGIWLFILPLFLWLMLNRHYLSAIHGFVFLGAAHLLTLTGNVHSMIITTTAIGLWAVFSIKEISIHHRWWLYGCISLILLPLAVAPLYLGISLLSNVIEAVLSGLALCALMHLSSMRMSISPIQLNLSFALALVFSICLELVWLVN